MYIPLCFVLSVACLAHPLQKLIEVQEREKKDYERAMDSARMVLETLSLYAHGKAFACHKLFFSALVS